MPRRGGGCVVGQWLVVKDVPNRVLRHIRLPNNADWPITHSRDTQEVPPAQVRRLRLIGSLMMPCHAMPTNPASLNQQHDRAPTAAAA